MELTPTMLFYLQFVIAYFSALFLWFGIHEKPMTLRAFAYAGFYSLMGGAFAPICANFPGLNVVGTRSERVLACAAGIGGGFVSVTFIMRRLLGNDYDDPPKTKGTSAT